MSTRADLDLFVETVLDQVDGRTSYGRGDLRLALRHLVFWGWATAGLEPEIEVVLRREIIDRFITVGLDGYTAASRGNLRSQLLRVAELIVDSRFAPSRLRPLASSEPTAPYDRHEQAAIRNWASTQSTDARRRNAWVLLSLGIGAGLSASEIGNMRARELQCDELGVVVSVSGARQRSVPVLEEWAPVLHKRAEELTSDSFVFRPGHTAFYPNLVSNFVARGRRSGALPQTQRMRSTWVVTHLAAGTPVAALMAAAGVDSLEAFTRYVRFVPEVSPENRRLLLSSPAL